jgi:hypothetical protein
MKPAVITAATCLALFIVYVIAFYIVPPSFNVQAQVNQNGEYELILNPNFVVNSIYGVWVRDSTAELLHVKKSFATPQLDRITLPPEVVSGQVLFITCDLQYDRIAPCITRVSKSVTVP